MTSSAFTPGVLTVTVAFAQNLKDKQLFGRQDPYCRLRVGTGVCKQTGRTRTASKGGRDPVWNETFSFNVYRPASLEIIVKDDRVLMDPTLGVTSVSLDAARANGCDKLVADVLSPSSRRQQGVISLSLQWKDGCPPEPEPKAPIMQAPGYGMTMHHRMHMANMHAHHVAAHNHAMMHHHMHMHGHHGHMHGHHHHHHGHCH